MYILIRLPNWLGDCVMFSPTLAFLHRHFSDAKFVLVGNALSANVFCENDFIIKIFTDNTKDSIESKNFLSKIFKRINATKNLAYKINSFLRENNITQFDYAITAQNNFFSAYFLSKIYAKYTIGYGDKHFFGMRNFLLSTLIKYKNHHSPIATHQVLSYINLTLPLLKVSDFRSFISKNIEFLKEFRKSPRFNKNASLVQNILYLQARDLSLFRDIKAKKSSEKIIAFCTGASFGESKMWLLQYFVETIIALLKKGYKIRIFGSKAEVARNESITQSVLNILGQEYEKMLANLSGRTNIAQLIESMSECSVYIGNDSGVTHIARALNIPSIIIFGPMPFSWCSPWRAINVDCVDLDSINFCESGNLDSIETAFESEKLQNLDSIKITEFNLDSMKLDSVSLDSKETPAHTHKLQNLDSKKDSIKITESNLDSVKLDSMNLDSKETPVNVNNLQNLDSINLHDSKSQDSIKITESNKKDSNPPSLSFEKDSNNDKKDFILNGIIKTESNLDSKTSNISSSDKEDFILNGVIKKGEYYYIDNCIAVQKDLPCVPCKKKTCPLQHHNCMRLITPDEILNLIHSQIHIS